jgi:Type II secretion system (T2SS), protein E, N-terminal domain
MPRIGELLVADGVVSEVAVQSALGFQRHTGEPFRLGTILLDRDLLPEENLLRALSSIHRCDYVTWPDLLKAPPKVVRLLSERAAVRLGALPYALEGRGVRVAFKNPSNLAAVDEVSAVTGRPVTPSVISEIRLLQAFNLFFGRPVPIEFRGVLQKLERNEERRLYKLRATQPAPNWERFVNVRSRAVPIAPGADDDREHPVSYAAPFIAAEQPQGEVADTPDLLPEFTPAHPLTPDELADDMWQARPRPSEPEESNVRAMWEARPQPARRPEPPRTSARDRLAESTLETVCGRLRRAMLLTSGQDGILGWTARGSGLTRDQVSGLRVPWGEPSIFAFVKLSGSPHKGMLSRILVPPKLAALLGDKAAASCAVFPVRIKDRLVAFLYADRMGAPLSEEDYRSLEIAASALGSSLARLLLDLRRSVPS